MILKSHVSLVFFIFSFAVPVSTLYQQAAEGWVRPAFPRADTLSRDNQMTGDTIALADPTIFHHNGEYFLYGTGGDVGKGFLVYTSRDLNKWEGPKGYSAGYALIEGESFGTDGFWAPQVFHRNGKFFMAYTANEQIAIAESDHPLGPFKQKKLTNIGGNSKKIDPYIYFDQDGRIYLYHVRLQDGNRIFVAQMKEDLSDIIEGTLKECIKGEKGWENTQSVPWPVAEGPTVIKRNGLYVMMYSANDFRNPDYAVGVATSKYPTGPWIKITSNPVLHKRHVQHAGTGHGDLFYDSKGAAHYVLHTHRTDQVVHPRLTAIVKVRFKGDLPMVDTSSFRYLRITK